MNGGSLPLSLRLFMPHLDRGDRPRGGGAEGGGLHWPSAATGTASLWKSATTAALEFSLRSVAKPPALRAAREKSVIECVHVRPRDDLLCVGVRNFAAGDNVIAKAIA